MEEKNYGTRLNDGFDLLDMNSDDNEKPKREDYRFYSQYIEALKQWKRLNR